MSAPAAHRAFVKYSRRAGTYQQLTLTSPGIADGVRPGQFVSVAVGGPDSPMVTRRAFSIHSVHHSSAKEAQTLDLVISPVGRGSSWLASRQPGEVVDVITPLGKGFALPLDPVPCLLVAGGYGSAPMAFLASELAARGCQVDVIFGASTESKLFGTLEAKRIATHFRVTTDDGSAGLRGRVSDAMPELIAKSSTMVVYACGPMPMLQAVAAVADAHGIVSQVSVEEDMSCGIGVCMSCVLPVVGEDGVTRMVRSCAEGPVFRGSAVRWDALGTVPADCLGAPQPGGH